MLDGLKRWIRAKTAGWEELPAEIELPENPGIRRNLIQMHRAWKAAEVQRTLGRAKEELEFLRQVAERKARLEKAGFAAPRTLAELDRMMERLA